MPKKISIREAKLAAESAAPDRKELANLYVAHLEFGHQLRGLNEKCRENRKLATWECCEPHRALIGAGEEIHRKAEKIQPRVDRAHVLSQNWWNSLGIDFEWDAIIVP